MSTSLRDVARESKVSVCTVSWVLNNKGTIKPETREMVLDTIRRLDYDPYKNIPLARQAKTKTIGLVTPYEESGQADFYTYTMSVFKKLTKNMNYDCMLFNEDEIIERTRSGGINDRNSLNCDGLVFFCPIKPWNQSLKVIKEWGIPSVLIRRDTAVRGVPMIINDDTKGMQLALEHLHDLGHRKIGLVGTHLREEGMRVRQEVYMKFHLDHGLKVIENQVYDLAAPPGLELWEWVSDFKKNRSLPTAFVCTADQIAIDLAKIIFRQGLRIPDDISIVGYNDMIFAKMFYPALTTIHLPVEKMLQRACEMIANGSIANTNDKITIEMDVELVKRESTQEINN